MTVEKLASGQYSTTEVDRRFSDFEKLLTYLRKMPSHILPELPQKRYFDNASESVVELRRSELEKFMRTLVRNQELRQDMAVRYFLS